MSKRANLAEPSFSSSNEAKESASTKRTTKFKREESADEVQFIGSATPATRNCEKEVEVEIVLADELKERHSSPQRNLTLVDSEDSSSFLASSKNGAVAASTWSERGKRRRLNTFFCVVCLEEGLDGRKGFRLAKCGHKSCFDCLEKLIKSSLPSSATSFPGISCPHSDCREILSFGEVRYIFRDDPAAWRAYSDAASEAMLERELAEEGTTRRCPAERCNFVFVYEPNGRGRGGGEETGTLFICPQCSSSFCLSCGANEGRVGPAHDGTCSQRRRKLQMEDEERRNLERWRMENARADERFQELIRSESKSRKTLPCPKCKRLVTKNGGCDHMRCVCGHNYNWSSVPHSGN